MFKYLILSLVILFLLLGVFLGTRATSSTRGCAKFALLNPNLSCPRQEFPAVEKNGIEHGISALRAAKGVDSISVYYQNLNDRSWFAVNVSRQYHSASLGKVLNLIWYYNQAESDPTLLQQEVYYDGGALPYQQQFSDGAITPGHSYTIAELLDSTIINSDNNALYFLNSYMGEDEAVGAFSNFNFNGNVSAPYTNVKTYSALFRMLYDGSYLTPASSEKALDLLSETTFTKGLRAGVPQGVRVAHKYGEWASVEAKQLHDCGIVFAPDHPYILCIMTAGQEWGALASAIADISKLVYQQAPD